MLKQLRASFTTLIMTALLLSACRQPASAPGSTAIATVARPPAAIIQETINLVEARISSQAAFDQASVGERLENGGQVRTGDASTARLDTATDHVVRLAPNTFVTIAELTANDEGPLTRLNLAAGKIWVSLIGGGTEVETPLGVAAVRGSFAEFEYWPGVPDNSTDDVMIVRCLEGTCALQGPTLPLIVLHTLQQVSLTNGGGPVVPTPLGFDNVLEFTQNNPESIRLVVTLTAIAPPTNTPSRTPSRTPMPSRTIRPTSTNTPTNGPKPISTNTPTKTYTPAPTKTKTKTFTPTKTKTNTSTFTPSITPTPTPTPTGSPTITWTPSRTFTPSITPTRTLTRTPSNTPTPSLSPTQTLTPSPTSTRTPSSTPTATPSADFQVNSTADAVDANTGDGICQTASSTCTLRAAIQQANALAGANTIRVPAGTYNLTITGTGEEAAATGDLDITDSVTIFGDGAALTIINGNGIDRVFHITSAAVNAQFQKLTIRGGNPGSTADGGGVYNNGIATFSDCVIYNNTAGYSGGGVYNTGTVNFINSSVTSNFATSSTGGGLYNDAGSASFVNATVSLNQAASAGGIYNFSLSSSLVVERSAIISNTTTSAPDAGGLYNDGGNATLTNVTVSGNSGSGAAGILGQLGTTMLRNVTVAYNTIGIAGTATLSNTIISNNTTNCSGAITSFGYNLELTNTCGLNATGDITGTSPSLLPLAYNSGSTLNHSFSVNNAPTIDTGNNFGCPATDQRGVTRPQGAACDIGAVEYP